MLSINPSEVLWTILGFFALYFLLKRFLYTPLVSLMDARKEKIRAGLDEEKAARALVLEEEQRLEKAREESEGEVQRLLEQQRRDDADRRAETVARAREEAREAGTLAGTQRETLKKETEAALSRDRAELSRALAERLLEAGNQSIKEN